MWTVTGKGKFVSLLKLAPHHEYVLESEGIYPHILILRTEYMEASG
jgi:hypothetical protein